MNTTHGRAKILLIAFDGLSFPLVQKWVAAGELPAMKRLMERGCYGLCKSFTPSNSAVIWTSVMTGMSPRKHGIDSFIYYKIGERILKKTAVKKLLKCGFRTLFKWFRKKGYIRDVPFSLGMVQAKMLWELFAQENKSVGVVNWWHSWPASAVPGFIISDRIHYWRLSERNQHTGLPDKKLVYPKHLLEEVKRAVVDPFCLSSAVYKRFMNLDEIRIEEMKNYHYERHQLMSEFKYLYSLDESVKRLTSFCLREFAQPDFLALYFRGIDIISHCALKYTSWNRDASITDEEVKQFGDSVYEYYCYSDTILEEVIETVSGDTTRILVSDHGFDREPDGRFGHRKTKPPGLFIVSGPPIKEGVRIENASLYDIAPTLLYLAGLPLSREMEGTILTDCIEEKFLRSHPVSSISTYGPPVRESDPDASDSDEEINERLRALGYID
jgi:predicted AlkP superfamily phosphohydrolase/phosphomutase